MGLNAMKRLLILAFCLGAQTGLAQQPARPAPQVKAAPPAAAKVEATCARYASAVAAAYMAYIRVLKSDLPELNENVPDAAAHADKLQALYDKLMEEAQSDDPTALRKLAALEVLGLYSQGRSMHDVTLRKVCMLARLPGDAATLLDAVGCAVMSVDETRRKIQSNRDTARQMMAKAKAKITANAGPADAGRMLHEDVQRGLEGCY